jgi:hypothetical protein
MQVVEDGYEFFAKRQLVTVFSAPNYCGEFDNAGAMMSVDEELMCSFQVGNHAAHSLSPPPPPSAPSRQAAKHCRKLAGRVSMRPCARMVCPHVRRRKSARFARRLVLQPVR